MTIKYPNMLNLPKSFEFGPEDFENQGFIDHCTGILSIFMIFSTLNFRSKIENLSHALFTPSCLLENWRNFVLILIICLSKIISFCSQQSDQICSYWVESELWLVRADCWVLTFDKKTKDFSFFKKRILRYHQNHSTNSKFWRHTTYNLHISGAHRNR